MYGIIIIAVVLAKIIMNNTIVPMPNFKPFTCLPCFSFWISVIILFSIELSLNEFGKYQSITDELIKVTIPFSAYALGLIFFKLKL